MAGLDRRGFMLGTLASGLVLRGAQAASPVALRPAGPELEAAAKAEGRLSLYTSIAQGDVQPLIEPFQTMSGVEVVVWRASGDTVLQRVVQEQGAGRNTVDVAHVGAPELEAMARENLFQVLDSPRFADLIEGAVPDHRLWASTLLSVWVQAYNTDLVQMTDLPASYEDLLDPRWKGKLGYEIENQDWFTTVVQSMGEEKGLDFFRRLVAGNGVSIRKGHSLLNNLVAAGEVPMALTVYNYMPEQAKEKGAPIDWFALEPAVARANGLGILKTAQSPNAAALFADYMLGEAQKTLAGLKYVPTSKQVASPLGQVRLAIADPRTRLDENDKWGPLYQNILINQTG